MKGAAWIYAALTAVVCVFHLCMAAGAPWGHLTMGGQWPGVLPLGGRVTAGINALLLAGFATLILARAGLLRFQVPRWPIWGIVGFLVLGVIVHILTPSAAERALWLPQITVMLICALVVARRRA